MFDQWTEEYTIKLSGCYQGVHIGMLPIL